MKQSFSWLGLQVASLPPDVRTDVQIVIATVAWVSLHDTRAHIHRWHHPRTQTWPAFSCAFLVLARHRHRQGTSEEDTQMAAAAGRRKNSAGAIGRPCKPACRGTGCALPVGSAASAALCPRAERAASAAGLTCGRILGPHVMGSELVVMGARELLVRWCLSESLMADQLCSCFVYQGEGYDFSMSLDGSGHHRTVVLAAAQHMTR